MIDSDEITLTAEAAESTNSWRSRRALR